MRAKERHAHIQDLLMEHGSVSVDELAVQLAVTASTIRRDLTRLTQAGRVTRTYGGAVVTIASGRESPLYHRATEAKAQKDAIASWAAAQVREGETIMLDAGTTVGRLAHYLASRSGLTVITNGLTSVMELADADDIEVIVLGGTLRHISHGFVGPLTDMNLTRLSADRAFLGADGVSADRGICEASPVQTRTKELMAAYARQIYVLADSSKIRDPHFVAWAPLERPWTLVTDDTATEDQLAPFRQQDHITVVVVAARKAERGSPRQRTA